MKLRRRASKAGASTKPSKNQSKKKVVFAILIIITVALIIWVYMLGKKAEQTVSVVMLAEDVYKNEIITEEKLMKYEMLLGEFEKYAVPDDQGGTKRRILLWEEADMILNSFAAYPLQGHTVAMYDNFIKSRVDNSDSVLYSFPGKSITTLDVGQTDLEAYKTFLEPGDRINVTAIYSEQVTAEQDPSAGGVSVTMDTVRTEIAFKDIMVADLINSKGDSILDIYASYNDRTVYEQAQLDQDDMFKESVTPQSLLVALTEEELDRYYHYISKDCEFRISLPQRDD